MKKILYLSFALIISICAFAFFGVSCGKDECNHNFSKEWYYDGLNHWHFANCEHLEEISELQEHDFGEWSVVTEPTCTEKEVVERVCSVCKYVQQETLFYGEHEKEGFWTFNETEHWHKVLCEHLTIAEDRAEHNFGEWLVILEPTCLNRGMKIHSCSQCAYMQSESIDMLEHTFSSEWSKDEIYHWQASTCLHDGIYTNKSEHEFKDGTCAVCGYKEYRVVNSVNHSGYVDAPENTLSAFRLSKKMGFDMVECDVGFTKDGVAVLLHDKSIDRTSNGTGKLTDLTYDEIKDLDFGSWKSEVYAGEKIPTLEEFLRLCEDLSLKPYIEIKCVLTENDVIVLDQLARKYDVEITWISFIADSLQSLMSYRNGDRFGFVVSECSISNVDKVISWQKKGYEAFIDCNYRLLQADIIEYCKEYNVALEVWTIDDKKQMLDLDKYISGFTSNSLNASKILNNQDK